MKLSHLDVCNAVLLTGSVSGAARLLHLSQPAVTKLLQSAENQIGFKLFTREKNRLVPTQEALELQPEIIQISSQIEKLKELSKALGAKQMTLRVAGVPSISATLLPVAITRYVRQFPNVSFQLETNAHPDLVERLMRRHVELGFSLATIPNPAVAQESIAHGCGVCVAPVGIFARQKKSVTWSELDRHRIIRVPARTQFGGLLIEPSGAERREAKDDKITATTAYLALRLVEMGLGVTAVDSFTASAADRTKVQVIPITPAIPVDLVVSYRFQAKLTNSARKFIQAMGVAAREAHDKAMT